jgi:hypothetical protein
VLNQNLHYTIYFLELCQLIRFDHFKVQYTALKKEIDEAVHRVLEISWFIMGKELEAFEKKWAVCIIKPCFEGMVNPVMKIIKNFCGCFTVQGASFAFFQKESPGRRRQSISTAGEKIMTLLFLRPGLCIGH